MAELELNSTSRCPWPAAEILTVVDVQVPRYDE